MRTATWDSGDPEMYFDNPNLRWGNPSYLFEPGDPGYVPPPPPVVSEPIHKPKKMKRNSYYPVRIGDQIVWLANFINKLPDHATALGLTAPQVTGGVADGGWLLYVLQSWLPAVRTWALSGTDAANEAQTGTGTGAQTLPVFTPPTLPAGVVAVAPGALDRIFILVQLIKDSGKCTDTIASDLGVIGSEQTAPDLATLQPALNVSVVSGQVLIKWGWGGNRAWLEACEIHVDRGDGQGYRLLTIDTTPNYTDTQAFPGALTKWYYKAVYRANDAQVGLWSLPVSVTVGA